MWVNGVESPLDYAAYWGGLITGNISDVNTTIQHQIGARSGYACDFYLADYHWIDGQGLTQNDFGAFDDNGVWQAAEYTGTYGTNGFHLDFADGNDIGNDAAGSNNWTVNNLTATGGAVNYLDSITGGGSYNHNAFSTSYISNYVNTSTWAITNTAWTGAWDSSGNTNVFTPSGGIAVSSSLIVYYGNYSNSAVTTTLTITYTDSSTETNTFTSGNNNWMGSFTASNAAGKTIQSIQVAAPGSWNYQSFGGFVIDGQILTSANSDTDVLRDSPTNGVATADTGAGGEVSGNYATWNPLTNKGVVTTSNGNLTANATNTNYGYTLSTIPVSSGKYYCEISFEGTMSHNTNYSYLGIVPTDSAANFTGQDIFRADGALSLDSNSSVIRGTIGTGSGESSTTYQSSYGFDENDTIGIAIDCDTPQVTFYKNGTSIGTFPHTMQSNKSWVLFINDWANGADITGYILNAGQRTFKNTAPSGFKALCTANLPTPTIADPSTAFDVKLWSGQTSVSTDITGYNFSPDFAWIKNRSSAESHFAFDTIRGAAQYLYPNLTNGENDGGSNTLTAFNSDGFTLYDPGGWGVNATGNNYVGWAWEAADSNTSISAGSLTSSIYNQDQVWSNFLSSSNGFVGGYEATYAFDGAINTGGGSATNGAGGVMTFALHLRFQCLLWKFVSILTQQLLSPIVVL